MTDAKLPWQRGRKVGLTESDTFIDPATAETYDAAALGIEVVFDLAAVTSARQTLEFARQYGLLEKPLRERTNRMLYWAAHVRLALYRLVERAGSSADAALVEAGTPYVPETTPATPTLLTIILDRLRAIETTGLRLAACPTDGRIFAPANPRARYCRPSCGMAAAKWRERQMKAVGSAGAHGQATTVRGAARTPEPDLEKTPAAAGAR
jgi:hypothetical protein